MIVLKKEYENNFYTLPGFDVSVDEWKRMLQDSSIFDDNSLNMVKIWYYEPDHAASSKIMTKKYRPELANSPYNGVVVGLGKRVLRYLKRYEIEREDDSDSYWVTIFDGWVDKGLFIWRLKDNIAKALEELNYVGKESQSRPRYWLFPSNLEQYNVYGAFEAFNELYWRQNLTNIKVGDKVFIYTSHPESKISFYCEVMETNVVAEQASCIDDSIFWINKTPFSKEKYVKIKLLKRIYDDRFNRKQLNRNGINGNLQGQQEIAGEGLNFILDLIDYCYLNINELESNIEVFKLAYAEEHQPKFKSCENERQLFLKRFPIENIGKITLKDYCLGLGVDDNFCYFLETRLKESGSIRGGSAHKFGVFYSKKHNSFEVVKKWSKTGNAIEALENIKKCISAVIQAGDLYDFYSLENNPLAIVLKGKILATYYPNKYIGIFGNEDFNHFLYKLGVPHNPKISPVRKQYQLLKLKQENKVFSSLSFYEFMVFLYTMYGQDLLAEKKEANRRSAPLTGNEIEQDELPVTNQRLVLQDYNFVENIIPQKTNRRKGPTDFDELQKRRTRIGLKGEELVIKYEEEFLLSCGSKYKPEHIARTDPSAGYDIISYDKDGNIKYIEVKTKKAKTDDTLDFYISANERDKFVNLKGYVIYFVSDLNSVTPKLRIITKEIYDQLEFEEIAYRVKAKIEVIV